MEGVGVRGRGAVGKSPIVRNGRVKSSPCPGASKAAAFGGVKLVVVMEVGGGGGGGGVTNDAVVRGGLWSKVR